MISYPMELHISTLWVIQMFMTNCSSSNDHLMLGIFLTSNDVVNGVVNPLLPVAILQKSSHNTTITSYI